MEHFLNGYLTEVNYMFKNVLIPKVKEYSLSRTKNNDMICVQYFEPGIFIFSINGEELL